jgi:hypothetical protein
VVHVSAVEDQQSSNREHMPMFAPNMSTTRRNDLTLIGIVLLACGIAVLATGADLSERLGLAVALWTAAIATFAAVRRR